MCLSNATHTKIYYIYAELIQITLWQSKGSISIKLHELRFDNFAQSIS
jgi:hypothetical protein